MASIFKMAAMGQLMCRHPNTIITCYYFFLLPSTLSVWLWKKNVCMDFCKQWLIWKVSMRSGAICYFYWPTWANFLSNCQKCAKIWPLDFYCKPYPPLQSSRIFWTNKCPSFQSWNSWSLNQCIVTTNFYSRQASLLFSSHGSWLQISSSIKAHTTNLTQHRTFSTTLLHKYFLQQGSDPYEFTRWPIFPTWISRFCTVY